MFYALVNLDEQNSQDFYFSFDTDEQLQSFIRDFHRLINSIIKRRSELIEKFYSEYGRAWNTGNRRDYCKTLSEKDLSIFKFPVVEGYWKCVEIDNVISNAVVSEDWLFSSQLNVVVK